jgi:hypothetical protein
MSFGNVCATWVSFFQTGSRRMNAMAIAGAPMCRRNRRTASSFTTGPRRSGSLKTSSSVIAP